MTNLLIRIFIGKNKDLQDPTTRAKYASLAGFTGIILNVLLFAGKLTVGIIAASVAIVADAFNNIADAGSAIIALIGFRLALKPVDKDHPQGHGRIEYVSGFIVDMLIIYVGVELFKSSFDKILNPTIPTVGTVTICLLVAAILVKFWLFFFYRKMSRYSRSTALKGSSMDSLSDCIATTLVLVSALIGKFFGVAIDGYTGLLVAGFIIFAGIKAAKETIDLLLGSPPDKEFVENIYKFTENYPSIVGIHDVMVHDYGVGRQIVSFHAEIPSDSDINIAHEEVDKLERDMHEKFGCIVTVHLDPIIVNDPTVNELRSVAENCAKEINQDFSIHDFRMTKGETSFNLIFDLVLPADCKMKEKDAENAVSEKIREKHPDCFCVIRAEHPFV